LASVCDDFDEEEMLVSRMRETTDFFRIDLCMQAELKPMRICQLLVF